MNAPMSGPDDPRRDALCEALGDDFEVLRRLGEGSTSVVYLARERALGRHVAIKVLKEATARNPTARRRFEREARAVASLSDHPDVVPVYRFGRLNDEAPYLVMRYVKGRTMDDRLRAEGPLPLEQARQALSSVASALAFAHEHGIVHRDVRPNNVMWDDESGRAYLSDFGIAAMLGDEDLDSTRLTATGELVGDPRYLSPEQLEDRDLTEQSDVYGFGVMGYELLSGEGPFEARSTADWIKAHLSGTPRDLRSMRDDVPDHLADLLRRCLARHPQHRPRAADLVRLLAVDDRGHTDPAALRRSDDLGELVRRRVPQLVGLAGTSGLALIGLAGLGYEFYGLPRVVLDLTIVFTVALVLGAFVGSWFHGEVGRQRSTAVEWLLYGAIGVVWLGVSAFLLLR